MSEEYSGLPEYQPPKPVDNSTRMATAQEQKPLVKMLNKMLKPKTSRVIKMSHKMPKKKHTVHFY